MQESTCDLLTNDTSRKENEFGNILFSNRSSENQHLKFDNSGSGLDLKPKLGLFSGIGLVVGNMIGSGIFISAGGVLERAGSPGLALLLWASCGILAIFGSLSYAELGTLIPKSGGEYAYLIDGLRPFHAFWGPIPGFLYSWISILLLRPASMAVGCLSCASYTIFPLLASMQLCLPRSMEDYLIKLAAVLYAGIITALNYYSVNWTLRIQNTFTMAKLFAIGLLIVCGIIQIINGNTKHLEQGFAGSNFELGKIATAFYGGLWAYDGWNNLNFVTEEIINPYVNLPRSLIFGIPLVMGCYVLVNIAYLSVLSPEAIISSEAVAVDVGNLQLGSFSFIIPIAVAMSSFSGLLGNTFATGRLCFASAREGHMLEVLSYVQVNTRIPTPALLFTTIVSICLIMSKSITSLIDCFTFAIWIFYVLTILVLLILRKTKPNAERPYKAPLIAPIVTGIAGTYLVVGPILSDPSPEYLYTIGFLLLGFFIYIPFVYFKYSPPFLGSFIKCVQLILEVGPPLRSVKVK